MKEINGVFDGTNFWINNDTVVKAVSKGVSRGITKSFAKCSAIGLVTTGITLFGLLVFELAEQKVLNEDSENNAVNAQE